MPDKIVKMLFFGVVASMASDISLVLDMIRAVDLVANGAFMGVILASLLVIDGAE